MSVYINTFRTDHKEALLNWMRVKVYAYRFLCKMSDADDHWGERKRCAALMQASMQRATNLFDEHQPGYAAAVYESDWEGTCVYQNPTGPIWYDCNAFPGTLIGFLARCGRTWTIDTTKGETTYPMVAGKKVTRYSRLSVVDGHIATEILSYEVDGVKLTPDRFTQWRKAVEDTWLAEQAAKRAQWEAEQKIAADARAQKLAAKDKEIEAAAQQLANLKRQRELI